MEHVSAGSTSVYVNGGISKDNSKHLEETSQYLPTLYQQYIHISRYSRWLSDRGRRETWKETITRYFDFFERHLKEECGYTLDLKTRERLENAILNLNVMPSMRCLMTAGEALRRENLAGYNCAYLTINSPRSFAEVLYVLMTGTGVGFSVERQYINKLPEVPEELVDSETTIVVGDSRGGWAKALNELVSLLYSGQIPKWDMSKVRPAGAPLRTFGGRASGPAPLEEAFQFTTQVFKGAVGRKLNSLECHDIVCKIAEVVVVGSVRRSALISLSNLSDDRMRQAKSGQWWEQNVQRALANNSVAYTEKPDMGIFMSEWKALYDSKSGERGIFNRQAAVKQAIKYGRRSVDFTEYGCNPCSEILLRYDQLCNLSEMVVRSDDTEDTLLLKAEIAAILGTFQSTLTNFKFVNKNWSKNCKEERLLGVSMTGVMDNLLTSTNGKALESLLTKLREKVVETNVKWSAILGIEPSTATTCVKPSGTVSQLVDCRPGMHGGHSEYIVRTIRADNLDPLCNMMKDLGFPHEPDVTRPNHITVFSFPMKCPKQTVMRDDRTAIEQLELWLTYQRFYCEHKPSVTITVKEHEWMEVGAWIYKNFDEVSGVSFLPHSDHVYKQAPYQETDEQGYKDLQAKMPKTVDWSLLQKYENYDSTTGVQELACTGGKCDF